MEHPVHAKHTNSVTMPYRRIKVKNGFRHILHLPGRQRVIGYSWDRSFRVWDLEKGTQVEEWEDKDFGVKAIALSPGGRTVATGSWDGAVKLWNIDTGKVLKTWTGHTEKVWSVCWSSDGGRVLSGSEDGTFRVWDIESGETIIGPIKTGGDVFAVCYSPNGKMIATGGRGLKIWDANTGELLKTISQGYFTCLVWTLDVITGGWHIRRKFGTATWTLHQNFANTISLSPNERILASTSLSDNTVQLWNLKTNQPIGPPLHHQDNVNSATFSADGKFLVTSCHDHHLYIWDVSAIVKEAGLPSDIADAIPRPAPKMKGAPRIPPGFFNDAIREANLRIRLSQSHGPHNCPTPAPRQRTLSPFASPWRRSKPDRATEPNPKSCPRPLSWTRNLVSGILRKRNGSDIQLREVEVPYTAGKPRNYHARKKPAASSSRPPNTHTMQQHNAATQSTPSSSQQPPPTAITSTLSTVPGTAEAMGTTSRSRITIDSGWRARLMLWVCCMPIQHTDGQH